MVSIVLDVCTECQFSVQVEPQVPPDRGGVEGREIGKWEGGIRVFVAELSGDEVLDFKLVLLGGKPCTLQNHVRVVVALDEGVDVFGDEWGGDHPEPVVHEKAEGTVRLDSFYGV